MQEKYAENINNDYIIELKSPVKIGDVEYTDKIDMSGVENLTGFQISKAVNSVTKSGIPIVAYQANLDVLSSLAAIILKCTPEDIKELKGNLFSKITMVIQSFLLSME